MDIMETDDRSAGGDEARIWDKVYRDLRSCGLYGTDDIQTFLSECEERHLIPFHLGGLPKGYAVGSALQRLSGMIEGRASGDMDVTVLDIGSGLGDLTVYMALKYPDVRFVGIDTSREAKTWGETLAGRFGAGNASFLCENVRNTSLPDKSIDFLIGFGALHHFIGEKGTNHELKRILRKHGKGVFIDSFHENYAYRLFHNKRQMKELGDELMTRKRIRGFWGEEFDTEIIPTDWMVMVDKLILYFRKRLLKEERVLRAQRHLSKLLFSIDRRIDRLPKRITMGFTGSVLTLVKKRGREPAP